MARRSLSQPIGYTDSKSERDEGKANDLVMVFVFSVVTFGVMVSFFGAIFFIVRRRLRLSEREMVREEENQVYLELNSDEQEIYFQSKEYLTSNPYLRDELTLSQKLLIQEKGVRAWEFMKDPMLANNDMMILNRYEITFFKKFECSTQTNLPIPMKNDVYYFESKIYHLPNPDATVISIGLGIKPYPWFRLPGRHANSVSYDSDGYRRYNQPFKITNDPPFPKFIEGDVIGVGYRVRSGTIFFTRNGKKVSELKIGGHIKNFKIMHKGQIFPIIGANNLCTVHVNIGQMGYVFIEGNVKKWGFGPLEGNGPAPPAYNKFNADILLERSEIDDDNDFSDRDDDFPPNFWDINPIGDDEMNDKYSYNAYSDTSSHHERITLNSIPMKPPSYDSDHESPLGDETNGLSSAHAHVTDDTNESNDTNDINPDRSTDSTS